MTRRGLLALLGVSPGKGQIVGVGQIVEPVCAHDWRTGPFYLTVAHPPQIPLPVEVTYEGSGDYKPDGTINVEHCKSCGLVRLGAEARAHVGRYYQAPAGSEARK